MWKTAIKLVLLYVIRNKYNEAKTGFKGDFSKIKDSVADLAESRIVIFKQNLEYEISRIIHSLLGFMLMLVAILCSTLTAIIWLTATALNSPHRTLIFSTTILVPLLVGIGIYFFIKISWKKEPLFNQSIKQVALDWDLFRNSCHSSPENHVSHYTTTENS
ncbi:MAG: phage holin family protein [Methylophilaceae bacterium]|nr:phage holin family protein [Methylophilaceae bacterium]